MTSCSLSIMVARTDIPFMMDTIPHLVKMCRFNFLERVLFIDTAPLSGKYKNRPGIGTMQQLRKCCNRLLELGIVDRVADIDYSKHYQQKCYQKYFGRVLGHTHNYRGYPIFGSIFSLEFLKGDYVAHFDSDMLLYQQPNYNWIQTGIDLIESQADIMFVAPLSGPPSSNGHLKQRRVAYTHDPRGFYGFKEFTSRKFLVNRKRLEQLAPVQPIWLSWKQRLASLFTGKSALQNWEIMISNRLRKTHYLRADLKTSNAWTLHTPDHGSAFIQALPEVIEKVESGDYPPEQAGDYDLQLEAWL